MSLGTIALPVSILMMLLRTKGPVQSFVKAGAISPETARKPASVGIRTDYLLDPHLRSRMLIATGDGRFYADMTRLRRRARLFLFGAIAFGIVGVATLGWWLMTFLSGDG